MDFLESLLIAIGFDVEGDDEALGALREVEKLVGIVAGAVVAWTGALIANTVTVSKSVTEQYRLAEAYGITTAEFQELQHALATSSPDGDFDAGDVAEVLSQIAEKAIDARKGEEEAAEGFQLIGIRVDELRDKDPAELLELWIERSNGVTDANKRVAASSKVLGDELGIKLNTAARRGIVEFRRLRAQARGIGVTMSEEAAKGAEALTLALVEVRALMEGFRRHASIEFLPALRGVVEWVRNWIDANRIFIRQNLTGAVKLASLALRALTSPLARVVALFLGGVAVAKFAQYLRGVWLGLTLAWPLFTTIVGPILIAVAAFALAAAIVNDLWVAMQGGDSIIGGLARTLGVEGPLIDALKAGADALGAVWDLFTGFLGYISATFGPILSQVAADLLATFGEFFGVDIQLALLQGKFVLFFDILTAGFTKVADFARDTSAYFGLGVNADQGPVQEVSFAERVQRSSAKLRGQRQIPASAGGPFVGPPLPPGAIASVQAAGARVESGLRRPAASGSTAAVQQFGDINISGTGLDEEATVRVAKRIVGEAVTDANDSTGGVA